MAIQDRASLGPFAIVGAAVALQVLGAIVLKLMADRSANSSTLFLALGVGSVLALDFLRFVAWWSAHRRYPLSVTIPISSLFFPAMLFVALGFGEPVSAQSVVGAIVITAGTAWLRWRSP